MDVSDGCVEKKETEKGGEMRCSCEINGGRCGIVAVCRGCKQVTPTTKEIWRVCQHKDFSRSIRFFMWMIIHGGYKVGKHWEHIPGHEEKGVCMNCEVTETMQHILTQCDCETPLSFT
jgi:hypothetical protein